MSNLAFIFHFYAVEIIQTFKTSPLLHREFEIISEVKVFIRLNVYNAACTKLINYGASN